MPSFPVPQRLHICRQEKRPAKLHLNALKNGAAPSAFVGVGISESAQSHHHHRVVIIDISTSCHSGVRGELQAAGRAPAQPHQCNRTKETSSGMPAPNSTHTRARQPLGIAPAAVPCRPVTFRHGIPCIPRTHLWPSMAFCPIPQPELPDSPAAGFWAAAAATAGWAAPRRAAPAWRAAPGRAVPGRAAGTSRAAPSRAAAASSVGAAVGRRHTRLVLPRVRAFFAPFLNPPSHRPRGGSHASCHRLITQISCTLLLGTRVL